MLIISDFRDFYDHILAFGIDKTVVFQRKESEQNISVPEDFPNLSDGNNFFTKTYEYSHYFKVIGFCGKFYPLIRVVQIDRKQGTEITKHYHLYSTKDVKEFLSKWGLRENAEECYFSNRFTLQNIKNLENFFKAEQYKPLLEFFSKYNVSNFVYLGCKTRYRRGYKPYLANVIFNPCLKNYDFVKVKDPVTAFQELMNYISGVLGTPERPMVKLSDKELAKKRGHGGKYSFRKVPSAKKGEKR